MSLYYDHGGIQIYLGDCREILPTLPKSDLLLTDPPYGIGEAAGKSASRGKPFGILATNSRAKQLAYATDYGNNSWDNSPIGDDVLVAARRQADSQVIFGGNYFNLPPSSCWLVWDKVNGVSDFADCELAWTNRKSAVRMFRYMWNGMLKEYPEKRFHPTQKPLALMKWCLSLFPDAKSVLDPFMGSGTTLLAAKAMGLTAIGIEQHEPYCEIAAKRLAQEVFDYAH